MNPAALDKMIADSMRDIGSEDDDDDDLEDADLLVKFIIFVFKLGYIIFIAAVIVFLNLLF